VRRSRRRRIRGSPASRLGFRATPGSRPRTPALEAAEVPVRDHYDFAEGVRGKYAERYATGTNVVLLEPELAKLFPDSEAVNRALRKLLSLEQEGAQGHR
jgi:hypothetical protein